MFNLSTECVEMADGQGRDCEEAGSKIMGWQRASPNFTLGMGFSSTFLKGKKVREWHTDAYSQGVAIAGTHHASVQNFCTN